MQTHYIVIDGMAIRNEKKNKPTKTKQNEKENIE